MSTNERIRQLRIGQGLTQSDLAKIAQLPFSAITAAEHQSTGHTLDTLQKIAHALGVNPLWVQFGSGKKELASSDPITDEIVNIYNLLPAENQLKLLNLSRLLKIS